MTSRFPLATLAAAAVMGLLAGATNVSAAAAEVRAGGVQVGGNAITAVSASDDEANGRLSVTLQFAQPVSPTTTAFVELAGKDACGDAVEGSRIPSRAEDTTISIAVDGVALDQAPVGQATSRARLFGRGVATGTLTRGSDDYTLYVNFAGPIFAGNDWRCVRGSNDGYDVDRDQVFSTGPVRTAFAFYFNGYAPSAKPRRTPRLATPREKRAIVGSGARCYTVRISRLANRYASVTYDPRTRGRVRGCAKVASNGIDIYRRRGGKWHDVGGMSDCPPTFRGVPSRVYRELTRTFCAGDWRA